MKIYNRNSWVFSVQEFLFYCSRSENSYDIKTVLEILFENKNKEA